MGQGVKVVMGFETWCQCYRVYFSIIITIIIKEKTENPQSQVKIHSGGSGRPIGADKNTSPNSLVGSSHSV